MNIEDTTIELSREQLLDMLDNCSKVINCSVNEMLEQFKAGKFDGTLLFEEIHGTLFLLNEEEYNHWLK